MASCQALAIGDTDVRTDLPEQQFKTPAAPSDDYADVVALPHPEFADGANHDEYAQAHSIKLRKSVLRQKELLTKALAAFYASGNSMQPSISNWDSVLIDTSGTSLVDSRLYLICWLEDREHRVCVKRAMVLDGDVLFASDSPHADSRWLKPRRMLSEGTP